MRLLPNEQVGEGSSEEANESMNGDLGQADGRELDSHGLNDASNPDSEVEESPRYSDDGAAELEHDASESIDTEAIQPEDKPEVEVASDSALPEASQDKVEPIVDEPVEQTEESS